MKVVHAHGCFDLLHLGHIRHLQAARAAGDYLVVTVTADRFVKKGPGRPVFTQQQRMEALRALACVDEVQLSDGETAAQQIRTIRPSLFAKGPDYSAQNLHPDERDALEMVGGHLLITKTEKWSSTALLNPRPDVSEEVSAYLSGLRGKSREVLDWLEKARALKVLVIGDAIEDVYEYCAALGKAGKEPFMESRLVGRVDRFAGGADAVAEHAKAVSDQVRCWTGPSVVKRRFVEEYPLQKVFGTYCLDEGAAAAAGDRLAPMFGTLASEADLVIVADYGHGFLTPALVRVLIGSAKFLAVNVQANAGNHGFSTISKYGQADFIAISERELRLDARDQSTDVRELMRVAGHIHGGTVLVTRGAHGCMAALGESSAEAPALATHTVDRMGAGDAVFGVTACLAAAGMPLDLLCYVASVVGTQAVGIVGNARYIERASLRSAVETWLR